MADSRTVKKSENTKIAKNAFYIFPRGIPEIILDYLGEDNDKELFNADIPIRSKLFFFGNEVLLLTYFAAYHALWGNPDKVRAIITQNPDTLLCSIERKGPNGIQRGTLYQLLLWADDNHIRNKHDKTFVETIRNALFNLDHGVTIEQEQRAAQFRNWDEAKQVAAHQAAFDEVIQAFDETKAITRDELDNDATLQTAIVKFKEYLTPKGIITQGKNCIPLLWDYAAGIYNSDKFRAYGNENTPKNNLFCEQILGTIDLRLPAWGMQVLTQGIYPIIRKKTHVVRVDISSLFNTTKTAALRLGDNSFMNIWGGIGSTGQGRGELSTTSSCGFGFQTYINIQKRQSDPPPQHNKCIVM